MAVTSTVTGSLDTGNASDRGLKSVKYGGAIHEEVMNKIWDISKIPLPLQDMISSDSTGNENTTWMTDELASPDLANSVLDGDDVTQDDTVLGVRVGNHCQTSVKQVKVSKRARSSNTIGYDDALSNQVIRRQQELRRDVDAMALSSQASVADNGTAKGIAGGLGSWIETAIANGTAGGFNTSTGLTVAPTAITAAGLTETDIRDLCETIYTNGGNPSYMMSTPKIIRNFSEYLFTSSARVATLMSDQGKSREAAAALGSVNIFITDFGITLDLVPNRIQQNDALNVTGTGAHVYIMDTEMLRLTYLYGYNVEPMSKDGLYDKRLMSVDWTLKVLNEKSQGVFFGADPAVAVTA